MGDEGIAPPFLTSALEEGEQPASLSGCLTPRETTPGTDWIVGWLGHRVVTKDKYFSQIDFRCTVVSDTILGSAQKLPVPLCW
jgi:hypothetical protein